jgi:hypothetical protein
MKIFRSIQPKSVTRPNAASNRSRKITVPLSRQGMKSALSASLGGRFQYHLQHIRLWRPNPKMRFVFADNFRAYGITPLHSGVFSSLICAAVARFRFSGKDRAN